MEQQRKGCSESLDDAFRFFFKQKMSLLTLSNTSVYRKSQRKVKKKSRKINYDDSLKSFLVGIYSRIILLYPADHITAAIARHIMNR